MKTYRIRRLASGVLALLAEADEVTVYPGAVKGMPKAQAWLEVARNKWGFEDAWLEVQRDDGSWEKI